MLTRDWGLGQVPTADPFVLPNTETSAAAEMATASAAADRAA